MRSHPDEGHQAPTGEPIATTMRPDRRTVRATPLGLLDDLDAIVWEMDPHTWQFTFVSAGAERILGYPLAQWMDEPDFWRTHIHPDDRDRAVTFCAQCVAEARDHQLEYRMIAADGGVVWVHDMVHVVTTPEHGVSELHGVMVDISRHKQLEAELRASEERLTRFAEASIDGIILHEGGTILDINTAGAAMFGYGPAELIGRTATDVTAPEDRARLAAHIAADAETPLEGNAMARDGRVFPVQVRGRRVTIGGRPARLVIVRDLTDQRRAEQALRESEQRYRRLVEAMVDAVIVHLDGTILFINGAGIRMLGATEPDAVLGRDILDFVDPSTRDKARAHLLTAPVHGQPTRLTNFRCVRLDGAAVDVELSATRLEFAGREAIQVVCRDITERLRTEAALHDVESQLRQSQKLEAVGRLAGGIAHDFNNLLTVITAFTEMVSRKLAPTDPRHADLGEVLHAARQAAELTRQLLAFSRKQVLRPEDFDLTAVVRDIEKMLSRLIGEDVRLETRLGAPAFVYADRSQLEQVLMNLVINARDAMPDGGVVTVSVDSVDVDADTAHRQLGSDAIPGPYVRLEIADTGVGMEEAVASRIFEPFFTTKPAGSGTGLGLSTVYGIVTQSGGYITVRSAPGRGTTFSLFFPNVRREAADQAGSPDTAPRGTETILLAEDEDSVRLVAQRILESHGYTVIPARNGQEAIDIAEGRSDIALLLTDVVMPRMNGHEAAARVRAAHPGIRVLFMSGYPGDPILRRDVEDLGPRLIQKPFTIETLTTRVRAALDEPVRR